MEKIVTYPQVGEVTLSRTRRSTRITLSVRPNGTVRLSFPPWVTQRRALAFLDEKAEWIAAARRKMAEKYPDKACRDHDPEAAPLDKLAKKRAVEALRAEAQNRLPAMTARLAAEHGFRHGAVRIKATRSRWGSCTVRNDINLSMSLAALPDHLAEYIVLHELCHTVHKNHSARFHALLDSVTGGRSKELRKELRSFRPDFQPNV
ncbi:MAG: M48 family metallopeptidase [Alistipes sp.]|nr:M48 family metallopeptidase [Alistipes sp.]